MNAVVAPPPGGFTWSPTLIQAETCRRDLREFVKEGWKHVDPAPLVWGWHHDALCDHLAYVSFGDIRFLEINMPPRTSKSLITSVFFPVWEWIEQPHLQFLTASYALQLSTRDCVRSRRLIDSQWFQQRWGHKFRFAFDEKTKRQYSNDKGGKRIALATEAATTGEGGNRIIIDDPHNASEAESEVIRLGTHDWFDNAVSSRLNDPDKDAIIVNGQRTHADDLFAHMERTFEKGTLVKLALPNEFEAKRRCITLHPRTKRVLFKDPRKKEGELLCPGRISIGATKRLKKTMKQTYGLQYQQDPKTGTGGILERKKWQLWTEELPLCEFIITTVDTAFEEGEENDFSARTDWGVFKHRPLLTMEDGTIARGKERMCIILLGAWRGKKAFPELKRRMIRHAKKIKPDYMLVEKKASGISLCQELSESGVRGLRKVSLDHGGRVKLDKVARAHLASVVLDDDLVYYVERDWAEVVVDECSAFPKGTNDDYVDCCLMAWMFLRRQREVGLWEDERPDGTVRLFKQKKVRYG